MNFCGCSLKVEVLVVWETVKIWVLESFYQFKILNFYFDCTPFVALTEMKQMSIFISIIWKERSKVWFFRFFALDPFEIFNFKYLLIKQTTNIH